MHELLNYRYNVKAIKVLLKIKEIEWGVNIVY